MTRNISAGSPRLEREIQAAIELELGNRHEYPDVVLWRNNCGVLVDKDTDRYVRFGVGNPGGADLLGVFAPSGRFIAAEIKTQQGKQTDEQKRFEQLVTKLGGAYAVLRSVEDARAFVEKLRRGDT